MNFRPRIIGNQIVNTVEQLACFLKLGDIFQRPGSPTQYQVEEIREDDRTVVCRNLDTAKNAEIVYNSPVFKQTYL